MQQAMQRFNEQFIAAGIPPIRIGIGVHWGKLMLGIVGEAERMATNVISDAINVAARLERLTRRYDVGIVASGVALEHLGDNQTYSARPIDRIKVKGRGETTNVYEIYDGDSAERKAQKEATHDEYTEGVELYYERKFTEANLHIARVLSQTPDDKVVRQYQQRIGAAIANGVAADWTGVELLDAQ